MASGRAAAMLPAQDFELSSFLEAEDVQREPTGTPGRTPWQRRVRVAGPLALGAALLMLACWSPAHAVARESGAIGEWGDRRASNGSSAKIVGLASNLGAAVNQGKRDVLFNATKAPHGRGPKVGGLVANLKEFVKKATGHVVLDATKAPNEAALRSGGLAANLQALVKEATGERDPQAGGSASSPGARAKKAKGDAVLSAAKAKYSQAAAKAFAALAKLSYCGPLPGVFASAAYSCSMIKLMGVASACEQASFSILPGTVRMFRASDLGEPDSLFGYMARLVPEGNESVVEPGVVIVIRGSIDNLVNSKRDKLTTMSAGVEGCKDCRVHDGYHKSYHRLEDQIRTIMTELWCEPKVCKVYVTGHGAGAAMAAMAAWELALANYSMGTSYVFESPQVGNQAWADAMTAKFSGEQGTIFSITNGRDSATKWPFNESFKSWGIEAHYTGMDATGPAHICYAGERGCGVEPIAGSELTSKDMCEHPLAPDNDFCTFHAFVPQCYAGLGFQMAALFPKDRAPWQQPASSAAATWHPSEADGEQAAAIAKDHDPRAYFSLAALKCVSALAKLAYCGPTVGLPSAVQSSVAGSSSLGEQCGFGVVPHSVHFALDQYQSNANATPVETPLFGYTALVRRSTAAFAKAPFFEASESCAVVFRGTYNKQNEALNGMLGQVRLNDTACPKCTVFRGLYEAWAGEEGLGRQVVNSLKRSGCQPQPGRTSVKKVFCVGHSMGGAMCTLAMYMLNRLGFQVELSWSIEGWRSGNKDFMEYINNRMLAKLRPVPFWHVAHGRDAVARYPASYVSGGVAGRARWQAYFAGSSSNATLCTSLADHEKGSKCGIYQYPREQLVPLRVTDADHCSLPFAPNGQQCMNKGALRQCFMGGDIAAPF